MNLKRMMMMNMRWRRWGDVDMMTMMDDGWWMMEITMTTTTMGYSGKASATVYTPQKLAFCVCLVPGWVTSELQNFNVILLSLIIGFFKKSRSSPLIRVQNPSFALSICFMTLVFSSLIAGSLSLPCSNTHMFTHKHIIHTHDIVPEQNLDVLIRRKPGPYSMNRMKNLNTFAKFRGEWETIMGSVNTIIL